MVKSDDDYCDVMIMIMSTTIIMIMITMIMMMMIIMKTMSMIMILIASLRMMIKMVVMVAAGVCSAFMLHGQCLHVVTPAPVVKKDVKSKMVAKKWL